MVQNARDLMVPHGLETWENIFQARKSQGILNRLKKSGNFTQNIGQTREF